jgi:hypothetical protein
VHEFSPYINLVHVVDSISVLQTLNIRHVKQGIYKFVIGDREVRSGVENLKWG